MPNRAVDLSSPIFTANPVTLSEITVLSAAAAGTEYPSPAPSVASCSAAVRPTGATPRLNTTDVTGLICEERAHPDRQNEGEKM